MAVEAPEPVILLAAQVIAAFGFLLTGIWTYVSNFDRMTVIYL
jgi:hypothetical protein